MKGIEELSAKEHEDLAQHAAAVDHIFGLPPGSILQVILKIIPILFSIGKLFGLGGTTTTPPTTGA